MTFDDVLVWCWYLDAVEEAEYRASRQRPKEGDE